MSIEKKAIEYAMGYEKSQGRNPKEVSRNKEHVGYDIISSGLKIEVKGRSKDRRPFFLLCENNILAVENESDENYRLYVVMNPYKNPKLIIFSRKELLEKKKETRQWEVPLRKADFERGIALRKSIK